MNVCFIYLFSANKIVRALFHYEAMTNDDISFRKGDRLELIEDT